MQSGRPLDLRKPMRTAREGRTGGPRLPFEEKRMRVPLRERRKRVRLIVGASSAVLLVLLAGALSYVSYLPSLSIGPIAVSGTQAVPQQAVIAIAQGELTIHGWHYLSPDNIFLFRSDRLASDILAQIPRVKSATVSRPTVLSNELDIAIVERQPFAQWCTDDSHADCYQLDDSGFIFAAMPADASSSMPFSSSYLFTGGIDASSSQPIGQLFASTHLPGMLAFMQLLSQNSLTPTGASVDGDQDFSIALAQGFYLKASYGEDPQTLLSNLQLVLSSGALADKQDQLEYVDLRFGDKVYYKLKGQAESSPQ